MIINRRIRTITSIAAIATVLVGCDAEQDARGQSDLDRETESKTPAQLITKFGTDTLSKVVAGQINGLIGPFVTDLFGVDDPVTLSQESLDAIRDIVTDVVDAQAWETEDYTLSAISDFIRGYSRSDCLGESCNGYSEYQQDEDDVQRFSEGLHMGWQFFAGQGDVNRKISGISQMVLISGLRMPLLQEIVELKTLRDLCRVQAETNYKTAACDYHATLTAFEQDYQSRIDQYTEVYDKDHHTECQQAGGYGICSYTKKVCFDGPRGEYCEEDSRYDGPYGSGSWDSEMPGRVAAVREQQKQEDYTVILGGDEFDDHLDHLGGLCEMSPTQDQDECDGCILEGGENLEIGEVLMSCGDGDHSLVMEDDGNLVLYAGSDLVWQTNTADSGGIKVRMQPDGNFVMYNAEGQAVWHTNTSRPGAELRVDEGNVIITRDGDTVWTAL